MLYKIFVAGQYTKQTHNKIYKAQLQFLRYTARKKNKKNTNTYVNNITNKNTFQDVTRNPVLLFAQKSYFGQLLFLASKNN